MKINRTLLSYFFGLIGTLLLSTPILTVDDSLPEILAKNPALKTHVIELVSDVLSVLPACFNVPAHTTADHLIRLLPRIKAIHGDFTYITDLFPKRLSLCPQTSHLDILGALF